MSWGEWRKVEDSAAAFALNSPNAPKQKGGAKPLQLDPYIHWSIVGGGEDEVTSNKDGGRFILLDPKKGSTNKDFKLYRFEGVARPIPLPKFAANPSGDFETKDPAADKMPKKGTIAHDTVIAGVVDVGMPLGHRRTRMATGKTRMLAAWQMLATYDKAGTVPFGRELYEGEINEALKTNSGGAYDGPLDAQGFNSAVHGLRLDVDRGPRDLEKRTSHGAHVLDALAGYDPDGGPIDPEKLRIVAVNAPSAATFGTSGTYLDQYMFHAVQRIVDIADAAWEKQKFSGKHVDKNKKGFPIVICMAFGKQAGAKGDFDLFSRGLKAFQEARRKSKKSDVHIVLPIGNDNVTQSNAYLEPDSQQSETLDWRVLPQDQSSNFVEIWADDIDTKKPAPLVANLAPPGRSAEMRHLDEAEANTSYYCMYYQGGKPIAAVYLNRMQQDGRAKLRTILCVAPTYRPSPAPRHKDRAAAPSGAWVIRLHNRSDKKRLGVLSVQTDQSLTAGGAVNLRSYFEHPNYVEFDPTGRLRESYSYPPDADGKVYNQDNSDTPVRRHGTASASAASDAVVQVSGYQLSDGRPAFYSSTGRGRKNGEDDLTTVKEAKATGQRAPAASLPTEDSPALFGWLSSGSSDGSCVAMRGTSFATPQACRVLIEALMGGKPVDNADRFLFDLGEATAKAKGLPKPARKELVEVLGGGWVDPPQRRRIDRRA